jgi:hypothetical protein
MRLFIITICLMLAAPITAWSALEITGTSGTIEDGESVTISGTDFGSTAPDVEWAGDNIEAGSEGGIFSKTNWSGTAFPERPRYDDTRAYSGSQSVVFDSTTESDGRFSLGYNTGGDITYLYATWMVYIDIGSASSGQWKMFRVNDTGTISDTNPEIRLFNWFTGGTSGGQNQVVVSAGDGAVSQSASAYPNDDEWSRIEFFAYPGTVGSANGNITIIIHRPGVSITKVYDADRMMYSTGQTDRWQYAQFHNYQGNGLGGNSTVWNDDYYISDSQARVEIGNASTWSSCTQREIQVPTSWGDSSITIDVQEGGFSSLTGKYLYVVDSSGDVSDGYEITDGSDTTAPSVSITTSDPQNISSDSLSISGTASDAVGVSSCKYRIGAAPDDSNGSALSGSTSWSGTASGFSEGSNTIYCGCVDAAGNWGSDSITVNLDTSGPTPTTSHASGNFSMSGQ